MTIIFGWNKCTNVSCALHLFTLHGKSILYASGSVYVLSLNGRQNCRRIAIRLFERYYPNLTNGNLANVLSPNCHSAVQTQNSNAKGTRDILKTPRERERDSWHYREWERGMLYKLQCRKIVQGMGKTYCKVPSGTRSSGEMGVPPISP